MFRPKHPLVRLTGLLCSIFVVLLLVVIAAFSSPDSAQAGGTVNSCDENSLRTALAGGGTVTFACDGTITLTNAIIISNPTTLDGVGHNVTISGGGMVSLFSAGNANFTVKNLSLSNGATGNLATPTPTLDISSINNPVPTPTTSNSMFSPGATNTANLPDQRPKHISPRSATDSNGCQGGAIRSSGILTIVNTTFSNNKAECGGGAIFVDTGTLNITSSRFLNNSQVGMNYGGGAISLGGSNIQANISNSSFSNNTSAVMGGGVSVFGLGGLVKVVIANSSFTNNASGKVNQFGGAVFVEAGNQQSTHISVINSTFSSNTSTYGGGAIANWHTDLEVTNSTFFNNPSNGYGGAIFNYYQGGGSFKISNSLLVNNPDGACKYNPATLSLNNLEYPGPVSCGTGSMAASTNPLSSAGLQFNGGPTQTIALASDSPAIDAGNSAICADPATVNKRDQRGAPRLAGTACDIGAVEFNSFVVTKNSDNGDTNAYDTLSYALGQATKPGQVIGFALTDGNTITSLSKAPPSLATGVSLLGECGASGPTIKLVGAGNSGPGLSLSGRNMVNGLSISGFAGKQLQALKSGNQLKCIQASTRF